MLSINDINKQWLRLERTTGEELLEPAATAVGINVSGRLAASFGRAEGGIKQDQEARHLARYNKPLVVAKGRASLYIRARGSNGDGLQPLVSFRSPGYLEPDSLQYYPESLSKSLSSECSKK